MKRESTEAELEVPVEFDRVRLADVADVVRGVTYKKGDATEKPAKGMIPILRANNIQDGVLEFEGELVYVPRDLVKDAQVLRKGDIVIATSSGSKDLVGKAAPVREDWIGSFGAFCAVVRPLADIDPLYLVHFLGSPEYKDLIRKKALGVNINNLRRGDLEELQIPLAPLPQQRRIVEAIELQLGRLDAAVARLHAAKAKLKRYKQAVLKAAVEGELIEGLEPEDWKEVCVEDVILGAQYGSSEKSNEDPAGVPVLAMGNIRDGELIFGKLKYYPSSYAEINKFLLSDGDVLFNRTNSPELVGKSAIYRSSYPKAVFASYLIRLTVNKDICDPDWLNYYMNSPQQRHYIKTVVTQQVGQANVNGTKMKAMPLPLPEITVQRKLVKEVSRRLGRANEMLISLDAQLAQSTRLRQSVLKRAFEGRLV